uniref:Clade I nitrous oxide reductase n=1 Tax=Mesocestoides corti TaxID=53468 RepID=A0A0R3U1R8_MESCO
LQSTRFHALVSRTNFWPSTASTPRPFVRRCAPLLTPDATPSMSASTNQLVCPCSLPL